MRIKKGKISQILKEMFNLAILQYDYNIRMLVKHRFKYEIANCESIKSSLKNNPQAIKQGKKTIDSSTGDINTILTSINSKP